MKKDIKLFASALVMGLILVLPQGSEAASFKANFAPESPPLVFSGLKQIGVKLGPVALAEFLEKGETVTSVAFPPHYRNGQIVFISTRGLATDIRATNAIYTYHRGLGTVRDFFIESTSTLKESDPLQTVATLGSKLILLRQPLSAPPLPCDRPSLAAFMYLRRADLWYMDASVKPSNRKLKKFTLDSGSSALGKRDFEICKKTPRSVKKVAAAAKVGAGPSTIAGCKIFPPDNPWNTTIDKLPVHGLSDVYLNSIGLNKPLHASFGRRSDLGIPITIVTSSEEGNYVNFIKYTERSDAGPYPVYGTSTLIESGPDARAIIVDKSRCVLYELDRLRHSKTEPFWYAESGAIFDLNSNRLRPDGWISADDAGLPILPGLLRYDEVKSGEIRHALRFTASSTQNAWVHPATHHAGFNSTSLPPMGARFRLKANFDLSPFVGDSKVILTALKKYGMFLADNGQSFTLFGATDPRWDDLDLRQLLSVPGSAFEAVDTGETPVH